MTFPSSFVRTCVHAPNQGLSHASPPLQSKPGGPLCLSQGPSHLSKAREQARGRAEGGRAFDSIGGSSTGAAGTPSPPTQPRSPGASPALGCGSLSGGAASFGDLAWQSLQRLGSFQETQPPGPALPAPSLWDLEELAALCGPQCSCLLNGRSGVLPRVMSGTEHRAQWPETLM